MYLELVYFRAYIYIYNSLLLFRPNAKIHSWHNGYKICVNSNNDIWILLSIRSSIQPPVHHANLESSSCSKSITLMNFNRIQAGNGGYWIAENYDGDGWRLSSIIPLIEAIYFTRINAWSFLCQNYYLVWVHNALLSELGQWIYIKINVGVVCHRNFFQLYVILSSKH